MAKRLKAMGQPRYSNGFEVTLQTDLVEAPLGWRTPRMVFVNSMSDLFHENVPTEYILSIFETMKRAHWHVFQVLTKRDDRLSELAEDLPWPDNVWMGVSVEKRKFLHRVESLRSTPAQVRFLSVEPLLGPLGAVDLSDIDWVIVGGESGPRCRPMKPEWAREVRDQCLQQRVPFFFKQWGGVHKKRTGRELDGRTWDQMPPGQTVGA